ncbi:MAG: TIGR01212 family radical SAM protein [Prevotella sp.]|jgi:hypothetical protein|nr:TIGR01212 family radical SAM protein [Prevotella sp.]
MTNKHYNDYGTWIRNKFPFRVQKIAIDGGFTCPNRDGTISRGGCSFCDNRTFNPSYCHKNESITHQIAAGKDFFNKKYPDMKYLAYFQAYTNTYSSVESLKKMYEEALLCEDVVGIVIGTRPDCVNKELLNYLESLSRQTFVVVEYGIESANNETLMRINRGHSFECSRHAIEESSARGIMTGGHVILGLPGEDEVESLCQAPLISDLPLTMLKIHQLQIIKGTRLEKEYMENKFHVYSINEYISLVSKYIQLLRKDLVLERFVSQAPKEMVVAPYWGLKNHEFTDKLNNYLMRNNCYQGSLV